MYHGGGQLADHIDEERTEVAGGRAAARDAWK